jgi:transposase
MVPRGSDRLCTASDAVSARENQARARPSRSNWSDHSAGASRKAVDRGRVRKNPDLVGFVVNPRRWVVERFFAWIVRNRRLAKDFEVDSAGAFLYAASVTLFVCRIARPS